MAGIDFWADRPPAGQIEGRIESLQNANRRLNGALAEAHVVADILEQLIWNERDRRFELRLEDGIRLGRRHEQVLNDMIRRQSKRKRDR